MLPFQQPDDFIWASLDHHDPSAGSVKEPFPTTASSTCFTEAICWSPSSEYSQPPNQPSETPPAIGVMPAVLSVLHAARSWFQVVGTAMWCCCRMSLRYSRGKDGCRYQGAVHTFPWNVSSRYASGWGGGSVAVI